MAIAPDGVALHGEAGAVEMRDERDVGRQIALRAAGVRAAHRIAGDDQRHAGLRGVGVERGGEIAAGNVEFVGMRRAASTSALTPPSQRRFQIARSCS